jgi:hypothetical protein
VLTRCYSVFFSCFCAKCHAYVPFAQYECLSVVVIQYHILTCRVCAVLVHYKICNVLVQVIQDDLKLNGTHQLLVYADGVNIPGG